MQKKSYVSFGMTMREEEKHWKNKNYFRKLKSQEKDTEKKYNNISETRQQERRMRKMNFIYESLSKKKKSVVTRPDIFL